MNEAPFLCPEQSMSRLIERIGKDDDASEMELDQLLRRWPEDPRLHFLKGSLLAHAQDYARARLAMRRAVDLAPDYAIARFQLGFLLLTCGEPHAAQEAWGPLHGLPREEYLHHFVAGLCHLIRDEFADAVQALESGIERNGDNPALNHDMRLIADRARLKQTDGASPLVETSSAHLLLQQSAIKATKH